MHTQINNRYELVGPPGGLGGRLRPHLKEFAPKMEEDDVGHIFSPKNL